MNNELSKIAAPASTEHRRLTYPEISAIYGELSRLKDSFGPRPDRRDRAIVLIGACILHRFNTRERIIKALGSIGLSRTHVAELLDERTGDCPLMHLWRLDDDERYHLLDHA